MIIKLHNRSLIEVSGQDTLVFLQAQFSNDVYKLKHNSLQINTYCQHQGKIIAIIWVISYKEKIYLSFPSELQSIVLERLNLFKMMSNVRFLDRSNELIQFGVIDEEAKNVIPIKDQLSLIISSKCYEPSLDTDKWENACWESRLPEIYLATCEKFTPQILNLDIEELGVSFSKGCYPGQEVVARMHYLGKPKRRLFQFRSKFEPTIGDSITIKDSESLKPSGNVIRVAKINDSYHFLGTLEIKHSASKIYLNNDINRPLNIING